MDKPDTLRRKLEVGQVVLSKQGKDQGRFYVIVGFVSPGPEQKTRVALADARRFNTSHPKLKNPAHIQPTSCRATELLPVIQTGQDIDRGHLVKILRESFNSKQERNEQEW